MRRWLFIIALVAGLAGVIGSGLVGAPVEPPILPARTGPRLQDARTWGYQLQRLQLTQVPAAVDVLVVDYSRDGTDGRALRAHEVAALQKRPNGSRRVVLSYLSIGEAETYRYYWKPWWRVSPPPWLGPENPNWKGNFKVRFWDPAWQAMIVDTPPAQGQEFWLRLWRFLSPAPTSYLDRIVDAGFDGIYLDRIDAFEQPADVRANARADMIAFVTAISQHAKKRKPGFLVVAQNAEDLLTEATYRRAIDGVAKEDLYYGEGGDGVPNPPNETRHSIALLNRAKADGKPVFTVEYLADAARQRDVSAQWRQLGFTGVFAERGLTLPPVVPERPQP